jgi:hypothetical protein
MPELSRFLGIVIQMFAEPNSPHHLPHFHVRYGEYKAVYSLDPIELLKGNLPKPQQRLVEGWTELHIEELKKDWDLLSHGKKPNPIRPLA